MSIRKLMGTLAGSVTALAVISAAATPAAAQGGVELTPWVGAYIPTSNSVGALDEDISRNTGAAGGVRLTFWGTGRLGFEATGGYAPAKIGNETVNQSGNTDLLLANGLVASRVNWLADPPAGPLNCTAKIRYRHAGVAATVTALPDGGAEAWFAEPQPAVTPGQAVAFYDGTRVLGGGWIEQALRESRE